MVGCNLNKMKKNAHDDEQKIMVNRRVRGKKWAREKRELFC